MTILSKKEQIEALKKSGTLQRGEKIRLISFFVGLVVVGAIVLQLNSTAQEEADSQDRTAPAQETAVALPPVDKIALELVKDETLSEQLILESDAFASLARMSRALLPGHLKAVGEPTFPFDANENPAELRGEPFRIRGELIHATAMVRGPNIPEEFWCQIRTDTGHDIYFVSMQIPTVLFGAENYVVADGYFFKNYAQRIEGERLTAPLFVGRSLRPSVRLADPVHALDPVILADVKDTAFSVEEDLEHDGFWHLMNYTHHLSLDDARFNSEFQQADHLNRTLIAAIAKDPELYRGKAVRLYGRPADAWSIAAPDNAVGLSHLSHAYLSKYELGDQLLRVVAPGSLMLNDLGLDHELLGYFLQLWSYEDKENRARRAPVFVVAGSKHRSINRAEIEGEITLLFSGVAIGLAALLIYLAKRDRRNSERAATSLLNRRQSRRKKS